MANDLHKLALKLAKDGPVKTLPTPRRLQLLFNGVTIISTTRAIFVWEHPYYPQYYIPKEDLTKLHSNKSATLSEDSQIRDPSGTHIATQYKLQIGARSTTQILAFAPKLPHHPAAAALQNLVKFAFESVDAWFEEDTRIYVHPKDPFKRVDLLFSRRPIRVSVDGHEIASSQTSVHLYETGLPVRYYLPLTSVEQSLLRDSETATSCPYKGDSQYYHVEIGGKKYENLFWYYKFATLECTPIAGMVCPYNEFVDIELDGELLERPKTHFSNTNVNKKPSAV